MRSHCVLVLRVMGVQDAALPLWRAGQCCHGARLASARAVMCATSPWPCHALMLVCAKESSQVQTLVKAFGGAIFLDFS